MVVVVAITIGFITLRQSHTLRKNVINAIAGLILSSVLFGGKFYSMCMISLVANGLGYKIVGDYEAHNYQPIPNLLREIQLATH